MSNQHAAPFNPNPQPPVPEPSYAERCRTLLHLSSVATLSTVSRKQPGFPFGSLMPYALDAAGRAAVPDQHDGDAYAEPEGRSARQPVCQPVCCRWRRAWGCPRDSGR